MNETIKQGLQMYKAHTDVKKILRIILDNALYTRPETCVTYRPFRAIPGVFFDDLLSWQNVQLDEIYPLAENGDGAYIDFLIHCESDEEIYLNASKNVFVWYNGVKIYDAETLIDSNGEMSHLSILVRADEKNSVRILCRKAEDMFSFRFLISVKRYPSMWANDYLFAARAVLPFCSEIYEEGVAVSKLIKKDRLNLSNQMAVGYEYPKRRDRGADFEFKKLFNKGNICYVYIEALEDTVLQVEGNVKHITVNAKRLTEVEKEITVRQSDKILICICRGEKEWSCRINGEGFGLSWICSSEPDYTKAICIGPFEAECDEFKTAEIDFSKVFKNNYQEKIYWKFCDGSDLRIYLDSVFFGQWFYALMVGFYGIRRVSEMFENNRLNELFCRNMKFLAKYFDYVQYEIEKFRMPTFMPRIGKPDVLDNIGTMGMNLIDAYFVSKDKSLLPLIEFVRRNMEDSVPRMEDGTFYRIDTMWADDLYMSCPFLVRMGRLTGEKTWYEKALKQLNGFKKRLYMEDERLFSHIYFTKPQKANRVPWGRGNGWVMWTLTEIMMYADGYMDISELKRLFCDMADRLRECQSDSGLWRQVINRSDAGSYEETSCTAMFLLSFVRGIKYGWLDDSFRPCADRAWEGLLKKSIDKTGNIYGVCMGSGCAMKAEYYYGIPTIINDDHGTGIVLAAAAEYSELLEVK